MQFIFIEMPDLSRSIHSTQWVAIHAEWLHFQWDETCERVNTEQCWTHITTPSHCIWIISVIWIDGSCELREWVTDVEFQTARSRMPFTALVHCVSYPWARNTHSHSHTPWRWVSIFNLVKFNFNAFVPLRNGCAINLIDRMGPIGWMEGCSLSKWSHRVEAHR